MKKEEKLKEIREAMDCIRSSIGTVDVLVEYVNAAFYAASLPVASRIEDGREIFPGGGIKGHILGGNEDNEIRLLDSDLINFMNNNDNFSIFRKAVKFNSWTSPYKVSPENDVIGFRLWRLKNLRFYEMAQSNSAINKACRTYLDWHPELLDEYKESVEPKGDFIRAILYGCFAKFFLDMLNDFDDAKSGMYQKRKKAIADAKKAGSAFAKSIKGTGFEYDTEGGISCMGMGAQKYLMSYIGMMEYHMQLMYPYTYGKDYDFERDFVSRVLISTRKKIETDSSSVGIEAYEESLSHGVSLVRCFQNSSLGMNFDNSTIDGAKENVAKMYHRNKAVDGVLGVFY